MSAPILSVVCGQPPPAIAAHHGDYLRWFGSGFGPRVELVEWPVYASAVQPNLGDFAGVLVTGSESGSLTVPEPWMEVAVECIRESAERRIPLLGVCFGHQLVAAAYGAPSILAPDAGEHGSMAVGLSEVGRRDPLFAGCPDIFDTYQTHNDQVDADSVAYSNGLQVLASSDNTPVQALAAGDNIRSVQFHPEMTAPIMSAYLQDSGKTGASEDCPQAHSILQNWLNGWIFPTIS